MARMNAAAYGWADNTPIAAGPGLFRDRQSLLDSELPDAIDAKRRAVVERWQKLACQARGVGFSISAPFLARPLVIDERTDFRDQRSALAQFHRPALQRGSCDGLRSAGTRFAAGRRR